MRGSLAQEATRLALALALALSAFAAHGAALPNHFDPASREDVTAAPNLPALRFLTTADYPPFNYRDGEGRLVGFNIDLARAICATLSTPCTVQTWPWAQAANALTDNQGDALIAGLAITGESAADLDFSDLYLAFPGRFVVANARVRLFDPSTLSAGKLAVRSGTAHAEFAHRYMPGVELSGFDTEMAALEAVQKGEAVAYFGDALRAAFWLNTHADCCAFAGPAYFRPDMFGQGLAIATRAGNDPVRTAINAALESLKRSGRMDELYLRWFPVAFY